MSFEFPNARAIIAIWKVFTYSVVFAGIVRAVIHLWEREEKTVRNRSEWCTDIQLPWKYLSLLQKKIDVSFSLCLCPLIEHKFRQNVKNCSGNKLWQGYDAVCYQEEDRQTDTHTHTQKYWRQLVKFIEKTYQTLRTMQKDRKKQTKKIKYSTALILFLTNINHCSNVQVYPLLH